MTYEDFIEIKEFYWIPNEHWKWCDDSNGKLLMFILWISVLFDR